MNRLAEAAHSDLLGERRPEDLVAGDHRLEGRPQVSVGKGPGEERGALHHGPVIGAEQPLLLGGQPKTHCF